MRARVANHSGTLVDLSTLYGEDWLDTWEMDEGIDQQIPTLALGVRRRVWLTSLAPDIAASRANATEALLKEGRLLVFEAQIQPSSVGPGSTWTEIFRGRITAIDSGTDPMTISADGQIGDLQLAWFEDERIYGVWQAGQHVLAGSVVIAAADAAQAPTAWWQAQGAFTTGTIEPSWPASPTAGTTTVSDNGGTWKCVSTTTQVGTPMETQIQMMLDDVMGVGTWTLNTPTSPLFEMNSYNQQEESLLSAISKVADLKGWDLRWLWSDDDAFELMLIDPRRDNTTSSYMIPASKYRPISSWKRDLDWLKNKIKCSAYDQGTLDASGNPTLITSIKQDDDSIAEWGGIERYMGIAEGAGGPISTQAQLDTMCEAVLSDLSQPPVDVTVALEFTWWLQLHDMVTLGADGQVFDADALLAISTIKHSGQQGGASVTELGLRGKPASKHAGWHDSAAAFGWNGGPLRTRPGRTPALLGATAAIAGGAIHFQVPGPREDYGATELHLSTTSGFTPSASTLVSVSRTGRFDVGGLIPGTAYYYRVVHRTTRGVPSAPSGQRTFTPRSIERTDLDRAIAQAFASAPTADVSEGVSPVNLGIAISDPLGLMSGSTFTPDATETVRLLAQVHLYGTSIAVGCRARIELYGIKASAVVDVGPWCWATVDADGDPEIIALYDQPKKLTDSYQFRLTVLDADGSAITSGFSFYAPSTSRVGTRFQSVPTPA